MSQLKLISLNIEGDNHLNTALPFLEREQADVVCLQEVLHSNVDQIKTRLGMHATFVPVSYIVMDNSARLTPQTALGLLLLSKTQPVKVSAEYYVGDSTSIRLFDGTEPNACNRVLVTGEITIGDILFRIISTHFTWSPEGESTPLQFENLDRLFSLLEGKEDFILCGDFNAPRGRPVWQNLAERYKDNIPQEVITTLDQQLHKVTGLQYVVDGLFSTKGYEVTDVRVISGVSDHQALVSSIKAA